MKRLGENNLAMIAARVKADYIPKSNTVQAQPLSVDTTPTEDSNNLITSGGVYDAVSDKEDTTNKVTSLSNANTDIQYPSAKAVYDSFYKRGVISQTQTWTQAQDGGYDYVMSDLVYGDIPKSNIDLFEAAGATFNATTGYFELNGLTDISYEEMQKIYLNNIPNPWGGSQKHLAIRDVRTNIEPNVNTPTVTNISALRMCYGARYEVVVISLQTVKQQFNSLQLAFFGLSYLKDIVGFLDVGANTNYVDAFKNCASLVNVNLYHIKASIPFGFSPRLSVASILYMINNEAATSAITITLHATAYARAIADTDVQTALQNHPLVTLASA